MKEEILAALDVLIAAAPEDPASVARSRRKTFVRSKTPHGKDAQDEENRKARFRIAEDVGRDMKYATVERVTLAAGAVSYTLWNTRETLTEFRKRFVRHYPKA